jgi:hypothetical protein
MPTTIFIHGLSNKPEAEYLHKLWKRKLEHEDGLSLDDIDIDSALVYWADVLYPAPDGDLAAYESVGSTDIAQAMEAAADIPAVESDQEAEFVARLSVKLEIAQERQPVTLTAQEREDLRHERIPIPAWLRNRLMAKFVRDAHLYFFNKEFSPRPGVTFRVRDELRKRFLDALKAVKSDRQPLIVLSHSMGTFIAYDCLMHEPACPTIRGLMTVGSPLGLDEVRDFFPKWTRDDGFPTDRLEGPWVNVYDRLDVVAAADPELAGDFKQKGKEVIEDVEVKNSGAWRHGISQYLNRKELRRKLAEMLQVQWT